MLIWTNGTLKKKKIKWPFFLVGLLILLFLSYLLQRYHFHTISGESMATTLQDGSVVLVDKKAPFARYNVVTIKRTDKDEIVKRIIGIPGDSVKIDGHELTLSLGKEKQSPTEVFQLSPEATYQMSHLTNLPEDAYFVLGDNPDISEDSRTFGLITYQRITGKVIFK